MYKFCALIIIIITCSSCSPANSEMLKFSKRVKIGTIIKSESCQQAPDQNYALYLPSSYDDRKQWPVIYTFDPHGEGSFPVQLFQSVAEQLGYIIIGSNNSRNGLDASEIQLIVTELMRDTRKKMNIDPRRVYISGFSGGARIAYTIAQNVGGIAGIIACSAGYSPGSNSRNFHLIGIAGNSDMNYLEMSILYQNSRQNGHDFPFIVFNGKHNWPPQSVIGEAVAMLHFYAMSDSLITVNQYIIDSYLNKVINKTQRLIHTNIPDSFDLAYQMVSNASIVLNRINNSSNAKLFKDLIARNQIFISYQNQKAELEHYELVMQQTFANAFRTQTPDWWKHQLSTLTDDTLTTGLHQLTAKRLLAYISLCCYSYVNAAIRYKNWNLANQYLNICHKADPKNPDVFYALACVQANTQQPDKAIKSLNWAKKYGFNNYSKMLNDPLLFDLHNLLDFENLVK